MSHRVVRGLVAASCCGKPGFARISRSRGAKRQGLRYESTVAEMLGSAWTRGQWFRFQDSAGLGHCQTDFLREMADCVLVLEAKLSWVPEGHSQLELLYRPVVEGAFGKPMIGLVISKRLVPECQAAIAHTLSSAISAARTGKKVVLHYSPAVSRPRKKKVPSHCWNLGSTLEMTANG